MTFKLHLSKPSQFCTGSSKGQQDLLHGSLNASKLKIKTAPLWFDFYVEFPSKISFGVGGKKI
jgi:hypothetical protein